MATEGGCDLVGSGNASFGSPEGRREIVIDEGESTQEWWLSLQCEIDKPTQVPPVLKEVYDRLFVIWDVYKDDRESLKERLDHFIRTALYELIIKFKENQKDLKESRKKQPKAKERTEIRESDSPMHVARSYSTNAQGDWLMPWSTMIRHISNQPGNHPGLRNAKKRLRKEHIRQ